MNSKECECFRWEKEVEVDLDRVENEDPEEDLVEEDTYTYE